MSYLSNDNIFGDVSSSSKDDLDSPGESRKRVRSYSPTLMRAHVAIDPLKLFSFHNPVALNSPSSDGDASAKIESSFGTNATNENYTSHNASQSDGDGILFSENGLRISPLSTPPCSVPSLTRSVGDCESISEETHNAGALASDSSKGKQSNPISDKTNNFSQGKAPFGETQSITNDFASDANDLQGNSITYDDRVVKKANEATTVSEGLPTSNLPVTIAELFKSYEFGTSNHSVVPNGTLPGNTLPLNVGNSPAADKEPPTSNHIEVARKVPTQEQKPSAQWIPGSFPSTVDMGATQDSDSPSSTAKITHPALDEVQAETPKPSVDTSAPYSSDSMQSSPSKPSLEASPESDASSGYDSTSNYVNGSPLKKLPRIQSRVVQSRIESVRNGETAPFHALSSMLHMKNKELQSRMQNKSENETFSSRGRRRRTSSKFQDNNIYHNMDDQAFNLIQIQSEGVHILSRVQRKTAAKTLLISANAITMFIQEREKMMRMKLLEDTIELSQGNLLNPGAQFGSQAPRNTDLQKRIRALELYIAKMKRGSVVFLGSSTTVYYTVQKEILEKAVSTTSINLYPQTLTVTTAGQLNIAPKDFPVGGMCTVLDDTMVLLRRPRGRPRLGSVPSPVATGGSDSGGETSPMFTSYPATAPVSKQPILGNIDKNNVSEVPPVQVSGINTENKKDDGTVANPLANLTPAQRQQITNLLQLSNVRTYDINAATLAILTSNHGQSPQLVATLLQQLQNMSKNNLNPNAVAALLANAANHSARSSKPAQNPEPKVDKKSNSKMGARISTNGNQSNVATGPMHPQATGTHSFSGQHQAAQSRSSNNPVQDHVTPSPHVSGAAQFVSKTNPVNDTKATPPTGYAPEDPSEANRYYGSDLNRRDTYSSSEDPHILPQGSQDPSLSTTMQPNAPGHFYGQYNSQEMGPMHPSNASNVLNGQTYSSHHHSTALNIPMGYPSSDMEYARGANAVSQAHTRADQRLPNSMHAPYLQHSSMRPVGNAEMPPGPMGPAMNQQLYPHMYYGPSGPDRSRSIYGNAPPPPQGDAYYMQRPQGLQNWYPPNPNGQSPHYAGAGGMETLRPHHPTPPPPAQYWSHDYQQAPHHRNSPLAGGNSSLTPQSTHMNAQALRQNALPSNGQPLPGATSQDNTPTWKDNFSYSKDSVLAQPSGPGSQVSKGTPNPSTEGSSNSPPYEPALPPKTEAQNGVSPLPGQSDYFSSSSKYPLPHQPPHQPAYPDHSDCQVSTPMGYYGARPPSRPPSAVPGGASPNSVPGSMPPPPLGYDKGHPLDLGGGMYYHPPHPSYPRAHPGAHPPHPGPPHSYMMQPAHGPAEAMGRYPNGAGNMGGIMGGIMGGSIPQATDMPGGYMESMSGANGVYHRGPVPTPPPHMQHPQAGYGTGYPPHIMG